MLSKAALRYCIVVSLCCLVSCDFFRSITAKNHKHKVQTEETIGLFLKKHDLDGCQVIVLHPDGYQLILSMPEFPIFNKNGDFLQITEQNVLGCRDEEYFVMSMASMLTHDQRDFIQDSLGVSYYTSEYHDNTRVLHTENVPVHLSLFSPYLMSIDGRSVMIDTFYSDLLLLYPFNLSSRSKLGSILLHEIIEDAQYLEDKYDTNISVVLLILDRLEWMPNTTADR